MLFSIAWAIGIISLGWLFIDSIVIKELKEQSKNHQEAMKQQKIIFDLAMKQQRKEFKGES